MNRRRALHALGLASILVAGCSGGPTTPPSASGAAGPSNSAGPTSGPASSPASSGSTIASGSPVASPAASLPATALLRLNLDEAGPAIHSDAGPAGHPYVLPAAVTRDRDGGFVLVIVWFGPKPGDQVVTVSRSDGGHDWEIGTEAILTDLGMELANPGPIPTAILQLEDGTWAMYGWAARAASPRLFTSWSATAAKPEGPWTLAAEQALVQGPAQSWDSETAAIGSVLRTADGYLAWYEGQGPGSDVRGDIGLATSTDGRTWRKADDASTTDPAFAESDPVIRRGICGAGTQAAVFQPSIERIGGGFAGVVGGFRPGGEAMDLFGLVSDDGFTWRCASGSPLLRFQDITGSQGIHTIASMPLDGGSFGLLLESLAEGRSELWFATVAPAT